MLQTDFEKERFLKVIRLLRNVRVQQIQSLRNILGYDADTSGDPPNSAFSIWNPCVLRMVRKARLKELLKVVYEHWVFKPNTSMKHCRLCDMWLNVGQYPDHLLRKKDSKCRKKPGMIM